MATIKENLIQNTGVVVDAIELLKNLPDHTEEGLEELVNYQPPVLEQIKAVLEIAAGVNFNPYTGDNPLTIGEEGAIIPADTLLTSALQILCGVSGGMPLPNGITKFAIDKIIPSSNLALGNAINHSLAEVPKLAILTANRNSVTNKRSVLEAALAWGDGTYYPEQFSTITYWNSSYVAS